MSKLWGDRGVGAHGAARIHSSIYCRWGGFRITNENKQIEHIGKVSDVVNIGLCCIQCVKIYGEVVVGEAT